MIGLEAGPQAGYLLLKILSAAVLIKFWAGYWKVRRQSNQVYLASWLMVREERNGNK